MPKISPEERARIEKRRLQVAANLLGGLTYRDMAQALGCSVGTIASDVKAIMKQWQTEQVTEAQKRIAMQLRRTDRMINAIWDKATGGDMAAIDRVKMLMDKQDKYIGIGGDLVRLSDPDGKPLPASSPIVIYIPDNGRQNQETDNASGDGDTTPGGATNGVPEQSG